MKRNYLPLAVLALVLCAVFIGVGEAIAANEDFVSTLVREFYNKTSDWESTLKRYALIVFRWLVTLEVCFLGIKAALILVAFGGSSFLKDYAVNAIRYVLAVAFKLFVMQLVLGIGIAFIEGFSTSTAELQDIFVVIGASVVLLALVKSLPDVCAGIINGSHVSSGAALTASAAAVGGAALGAAVAGSNTIQNVKDASKVAGMEGATGLGKAASMAKSLWGARQDAKTLGEKSLRTRSEMQERLERARMNQNDKS